MKKINKKVVLGTFAALTIAAPIVAVTSCSAEAQQSKNVVDFTLTINKSSVLKDGWTFDQKNNSKRKILVEKTETVMKTDEVGVKKQVTIITKSLSSSFVDYLMEKISKVDLTEEYKTIFLDLGEFYLTKVGDYFWDKMKTIKINKTKYHIGPKGGTEKNAKEWIGSSGIFLNLRGNNLEIVDEALEVVNQNSILSALSKGPIDSKNYLDSWEEQSNWQGDWSMALKIKKVYKKISEAPSLVGVAFYFDDNHKFPIEKTDYEKLVFSTMGINKFYNNILGGGSKFEDSMNTSDGDWGTYSLLRIKDFYKKLYGMSRKQFKKIYD